DLVTGVQTCALPIYNALAHRIGYGHHDDRRRGGGFLHHAGGGRAGGEDGIELHARKFVSVVLELARVVAPLDDQVLAFEITLVAQALNERLVEGTAIFEYPRKNADVERLVGGLCQRGGW